MGRASGTPRPTLRPVGFSRNDYHVPIKLLLLLAALSLSCSDAERRKPPLAASGDPTSAKRLIEKYTCTSCHRMPGLDGDHGSLGPSLEGIASRPTFAGGVPNNRETITSYLQDPQSVHPQTTMPALGINPDEAREITAYLFTLK